VTTSASARGPAHASAAPELARPARRAGARRRWGGRESGDSCSSPRERKVKVPSRSPLSGLRGPSGGASRTVWIVVPGGSWKAPTASVLRVCPWASPLSGSNAGGGCPLSGVRSRAATSWHGPLCAPRSPAASGFGARTQVVESAPIDELGSTKAGPSACQDARQLSRRIRSSHGGVCLRVPGKGARRRPAPDRPYTRTSGSSGSADGPDLDRHYGFSVQHHVLQMQPTAARHPGQPHGVQRLLGGDCWRLCLIGGCDPGEESRRLGRPGRGASERR